MQNSVWEAGTFIVKAPTLGRRRAGISFQVSGLGQVIQTQLMILRSYIVQAKCFLKHHRIS